MNSQLGSAQLSRNQTQCSANSPLLSVPTGFSFLGSSGNYFSLPNGSLSSAKHKIVQEFLEKEVKSTMELTPNTYSTCFYKGYLI